jgi:hypothetical protein
MHEMTYDFSEVSLVNNLQKAIATNNNMMLHYWMIYLSAMTKPEAFKPNYYLNEPSYGWINQSNSESNRYLKSDSFLESFNEYMKFVIKLHSTSRRVSYPASAMNSLLDKYNAEIMRTFLEIQETPHEVVYRMDDVRLLHYYQVGNNGAAIKYSTPLVIVYAPVNSYHIMDTEEAEAL